MINTVWSLEKSLWLWKAAGSALSLLCVNGFLFGCSMNKGFGCPASKNSPKFNKLTHIIEGLDRYLWF